MNHKKIIIKKKCFTIILKKMNKRFNGLIGRTQNPQFYIYIIIIIIIIIIGETERNSN